MHELQPITLDLDNLDAAIIILQRGFLGCQLPI
jgi:hypothetical protein